ncbi:MAG: type II secretion system protein GspK [Pirellulales bacterium]
MKIRQQVSWCGVDTRRRLKAHRLEAHRLEVAVQRRSPDSSSRRGMVVVVVAVVILMVSVSAYGFLLNMRTEYQGVKAERGRVLARQAAHSAQELLLHLSSAPLTRRRELGGLEQNPTLFGPTAVLPATAQWTGTTDVPKFWVCRPGAESPTGAVIWGAVDESTKLHLSSLVAWDKSQSGAGRLALMRIPGMTEAAADALLDWIDPDDQPRPVGAERDFYQQLGSGQLPQNGLPWTFEQLLGVRGIDRWLLLGDTPMLSLAAANPNPGLPSTSGSASGSASGSLLESNFGQANSQVGASGPRLELSSGVERQYPWTHYLTIYSAERNTAADGQRRIDLNQSDLASLHQQLSVRLPVEWANYIVLWRQFGPAPSTPSGGPSDLHGASQVTVDFSRPAKATLGSPLDLLGGGVLVGESGQQRWIGSPLSDDPGQLREELPRLLDATTTDANDRIAGRVNVNTAPREVLLAVPRLTEELVERIVAARANLSGSAIVGRDPAWLLTEGLVDLAKFKELLPLLTIGGDVYQAECWGYVQPRLPMAGFRVVIDGAANPPRCVDYQELPVVDRQRWETLMAMSATPGASSPPGDEGANRTGGNLPPTTNTGATAPGVLNP